MLMNLQLFTDFSFIIIYIYMSLFFKTKITFFHKHWFSLQKQILEFKEARQKDIDAYVAGEDS